MMSMTSERLLRKCKHQMMYLLTVPNSVLISLPDHGASFLFLQKDVGSRDSSHLRESDRTSDRRRSRPLLGYDWIAGAAF